MSNEPVPPETAEQALARLTDKGTRILDLCLELQKDLCVKGFIDAQLELGHDRLAVVLAMQQHVEAELARAPHGNRRRQLEGIHKYVSMKLHDVASILQPAATEEDAG